MSGESSMTEISKESIQPSSDTINVLPLLNEAKAPISLTLSIDKSVSKVAAWVVGLIVGMAVLVGAGIVAAIWMLNEYQDAKKESRLVEYYLMDPHMRTPEELSAWAKFKEEHK